MKFQMLLIVFAVIYIGIVRGLMYLGSSFNKLSMLEDGLLPRLAGLLIALMLTVAISDKWFAKKN